MPMVRHDHECSQDDAPVLSGMTKRFHDDGSVIRTKNGLGRLNAFGHEVGNAGFRATVNTKISGMRR